jgi:IS5 family transposase
LILDHSVHVGNPGDVDLIRPAVERVTRLFGVAPDLLTADRGYWDSTIETDLTEAGIGTVVIPRTGKPSQARQSIERADDFVDAVKWRTGCEGRISALKRECGWRRTRLRTHDGARTWCAHGVFAHNLTTLVRLRTGRCQASRNRPRPARRGPSAHDRQQGEHRPHPAAEQNLATEQIADRYHSTSPFTGTSSGGSR